MEEFTNQEESNQEEVKPEVFKPAEKTPKSFKSFYWGLGAGVVLLLILTIGFFDYRALRTLADDGATMAIAKATGLPAGFVNGKRIAFDDYIGDLKAVKKYYTAQLKDGSLPRGRLEQSVWDRKVANIVIAGLADRLKITVSQKEIDDEFARASISEGSAEKAAQTIKDTYGMTVTEFKDRAIRYTLLYQKLNTASSTTEFLAADSKDSGAATPETLDAYIDKQIKAAKVWKWIKK